ncbi:uncharacterized protein LOC114959711 [Acropora millepora]|uniref:uncharacterized protein LOC114959711 n=1 Tax=Acropora millepora TaxID=45264 RepID=UPI001CF20629|nr:uncharacterized protein LOC114959711 [Acropora millepora]XP_029193679.2 uncharacterized protein LOC114959711 [Acropora millepora]XP_029193680.2 uncharacterized protein LOC114959711 [Acropora millepora]XP_029193681.2 uncharacterized protein LOC114959711 [Acropora millepora]XP_044177806.1 uncharacterized protein LOC114959711 [Acropora millepora]
MALTSSLPCIDTLAFQLQRHRLDENRHNIKPAFCCSWSEPFDLDFAGKAHSNPKRSRSLPTALTAKRKESAIMKAHQFAFGGLKKANESDENLNETHEIGKAGVDIHSTSLHTSPGHLILSVDKYANQENLHKDPPNFSESPEGSDEEVSGLLVNSVKKSDDLPINQVVLAEITPSTRKFIQSKNRIPGLSSALKRNLDEQENSSHVKKRHRPRLDFEKMQRSRNMVAPIQTREPSIFDEVYFKPIIKFNKNE